MADTWEYYLNDMNLAGETERLTGEFTAGKVPPVTPENIKLYQDIAASGGPHTVNRGTRPISDVLAMKILQNNPEFRKPFELAIAEAKKKDAAKPLAQQTAESAAKLQSGLDQINTDTRDPKEMEAKKKLESMKAAPAPTPKPQSGLLELIQRIYR